jgi:hypothetical protein
MLETWRGGGGGADIFEAIGVTNPGPGTGVQIILIKVQQCTVVQIYNSFDGYIFSLSCSYRTESSD